MSIACDKCGAIIRETFGCYGTYDYPVSLSLTARSRAHLCTKCSAKFDKWLDGEE